MNEKTLYRTDSKYAIKFSITKFNLVKGGSRGKERGG